MKQLKHDLVSAIETEKYNDNSMINSDLESHRRDTNKTVSTMLRLSREFIKSSIDDKLDYSKSLEDIDAKYKQLYNPIYTERITNFTTYIDRVSTLRLFVKRQENNNYLVIVRDIINEFMYEFEVSSKMSLFIMLTMITRSSPEDLLTLIKDVDEYNNQHFFVTNKQLSEEEIENLFVLD